MPTTDESDGPAPPPPPPKPRPPRDVGKPNQTIYVRNLNEKINLQSLKHGLRSVFAPHGDVVNVVARKGIRMRGQAFVVFRDMDGAQRALKLHGFPLFNKPLEVLYAKEKSDYVARLAGVLDEAKARRLAGKAEQERKFQELAQKAAANGAAGMAAAEEKLAQQAATVTSPMGYGYPPAAAAYRPAPAAPQIPDEMLPPHNILFVQNVPTEATEAMLEALFRRYPGFKEVRPVASRHDIAFVEYENEFMAGAAKTALNGYQIIPDSLIKVTFGRK